MYVSCLRFQSHAVVMSGVNGMFIGFGAMINSAIIPNISKSRIGPHGVSWSVCAGGISDG